MPRHSAPHPQACPLRSLPLESPGHWGVAFLHASHEGERVNILDLTVHGAFDRVGLARPLAHCFVLVGRVAVRHWFV